VPIHLVPRSNKVKKGSPAQYSNVANFISVSGPGVRPFHKVLRPVTESSPASSKRAPPSKPSMPLQGRQGDGEHMDSVCENSCHFYERLEFSGRPTSMDPGAPLRWVLRSTYSPSAKLRPPPPPPLASTLTVRLNLMLLHACY